LIVVDGVVNIRGRHKLVRRDGKPLTNEDFYEISAECERYLSEKHKREDARLKQLNSKPDFAN
jgi:hypothetical protein